MKNPKLAAMAAKATKNQKKRRGVTRAARVLNLRQPSNHYQLALVDPFHPDAEGARVPDLFTAHTQTFKYRLSNTVTVDASGNACVTIFPNPHYAMVAENGTMSTGGQITYMDGTNIATNVSYGFPVPNSMRAWRIVGYGVRVTNLSSMTNSQGKFTVGTYPIDSFMKVQKFNGANVSVAGVTPSNNAAVTVNVTFNAWGLPTSGTSVVLSNLVEFPGAQVISALEMAENEVDLVPRPVDPRAFEFVNTENAVGWDAVDAAAAPITAGRADFTRLSGFEAAFVVVQGAVASTSTFDVEVVYHVEASLLLNATTGTATGVSAARSPSDWPGFLNALQMATSIPAVRTGVIEGASMIHPILGRLAGGLLSN